MKIEKVSEKERERYGGEFGCSECGTFVDFKIKGRESGLFVLCEQDFIILKELLQDFKL